MTADADDAHERLAVGGHRVGHLLPRRAPRDRPSSVMTTACTSGLARDGADDDEAVALLQQRRPVARRSGATSPPRTTARTRSPCSCSDSGCTPSSVGGDVALDDLEALDRLEQVLHELARDRRHQREAEHATGRLRGGDDDVGAALLEHADVLALPRDGDDAWRCGASRRAVSTTSTEVSSRSVATTTRWACCTDASRSTSSRVASPTTPTAPSAVASSTAACVDRRRRRARRGVVPWSMSAWAALRPLTPNPTITVWSLHRSASSGWRGTRHGCAA